MISKDREYRNFEFRMEGEDMKVAGKPVVFNVETVLWEHDGIQYKEKISPDALREADLSDVVLNIDHSGKPAAKTRNGSLKLETREDGLYMEADLSKNATGRELYEDIKNGFYDSMSFAFKVEAEEYDRSTRTRTVTKIKKLWDVSAVTHPAYEQTNLQARSWAKAEAEAERVSEETKLRKELLLKTYF